MLIANLFIVAELPPESLRRALADLLAIRPEAVDVADADGDQEGRHWDAPVLCTWRLLPPGDLSLELDITVEDRTATDHTEKDLALGLAARTGTSVLHPSDLDLPSAYWVAVPDGRSVRCRHPRLRRPSRRLPEGQGRERRRPRALRPVRVGTTGPPTGDRLGPLRAVQGRPVPP
ncbi:hypothetical protein GCM10010383_17590 [Streptomyces lomondensis]|uniref:Uncharacterized protein n=1 Tax=Streptomyces lomondensis TaxID=68229 RepID=A0ABQ2X080_9ACTN|nr:hypothetical protein GCM10010383_17590 [Streptomyces lomondensis]